jgi:ABC-type glycerol-3-phosphate transport system substrate-binding protein
MKNNKVVAFASALIVAGSSAASIAPAAANTTLKIAYQGPLTGSEAQTGLDGVRGVKLALKLYNAKKPAVKVKPRQSQPGSGLQAGNLTNQTTSTFTPSPLLIGGGIAAIAAIYLLTKKKNKK